MAINGLDGELSGLQKDATKTELTSSFDRGVVATEKEEDDQFLHWVFHRQYVGCNNSSKTINPQLVGTRIFDFPRKNIANFILQAFV